MKKILKYFVAIALLIYSTGCIDVHLKLKLKPDGSGTIEETVYMSSAMVSMMKSFMAMGDSAEAANFNLFDEAELKEEAADYGAGVRYVSGERLTDNEREGYSAIYEFDDINKIKMEEDVTDKATGEEGEIENNPEDDITFQFTKGNPAKLIIKMPPPKDDIDIDTDEPEAEEEETAEYDEWVSEVKNLIKDFAILIQLELDGDIVETNATYIDGSTITLIEMRFDEIMENPEKFEELKKLKPKSMEDAREVLKNLPGIKMELNETVEVKFE